MKLTITSGMMCLVASVVVLVSLQPAYAQTATYTDRTSENLFTFHQDRDTLSGVFLGYIPSIFNQDTAFTNVPLNGRVGSYTTPYARVGFAGTSMTTGTAIIQVDVTVPKGFTTSGSTVTQNFPNAFYHSFDCDADRTEIFDGNPGLLFNGFESNFNINVLPYVRQITLTNTDGTTNSPAGDLLDYNVCIAPEGLADNHDYIDVPPGSPDRFVNAYTPPTGWSVTQESQSTVTLITPDSGSAITQYARVVLIPAAGDSTNINATGNELLAEATNFIRYNPVPGNPAPNGIDTLSFEAPFLDGVIAIPTMATQTIFGSMGSENGQFDDPRGIAVNSTHIMVVDRDNDRVQTLVFSGTYVNQFGSRGTSNGEFTTPQGITTNSTHILVADQQNHRIQIFDYSGNYVGQFGGTGTGNGQFDSPNGITTNSTHILVADSNNDRIQILDHSGNYVSEFGSTGTGNGQFDTPHGIITNPTHILVADSDNDRIQIFDHSGNYVNQFGSTGTGDGEFDTPRGIAVTTTHILVTDELNHRIQTFDLAGNYVSQFGSMGTGDGQFNNPYGIDIDIEDVNVFVSDTGNHRIHIYALAMLVPSDNTKKSDDNIVQSKPHFGKSPLTQQQLVSCGFSMDGQCRDVMDYHVQYERTVIQTGTSHDFTLKPFSNYNLKMVQLGFGVEQVGASINTAEALIEVELARDYESDVRYTIQSVKTTNNLESVIDEVTESNVRLSSESCRPGASEECLVVHIDDVLFRETFYSEPFAINVVDVTRLSSTNYMNEGLELIGESLNPAPEHEIITGKKVQQELEVLQLVRTDKLNNIWTDNNGNTWTRNDVGSWLQLTYTPYVEPQDPAMSVMTRINNNFDALIEHEMARAVDVFDSSKISG